jgi:hypothetical protein
MPGPNDLQVAHIEVDLYLHVRLLISIILGLSVTRLLGGLTQFMGQSDRHRVSWIHLAWVAWVLFNDRARRCLIRQDFRASGRGG